MSSELEGLLGLLPEPEPEVGERALARALAALPAPASPSRRPVRTLALLLAAALVLLALAAGALAAAGALHVSFGRVVHHRAAVRPGPAQLILPRGARGVAAVVDGRLSLVTSGGVRLQGLPVSAAALSPRALYVAAGIGDALVALAPDGRRAWSHPAGGHVAAIAWAPDGLRIAYVVHTRDGYRLRVIEGNGRRDELVDDSVRPVTPSWRADSLAFAYVASGGKPVVYDLAHRSRRVLPVAEATRLAFAPSGRVLAVGTNTAYYLDGARGGGDFRPSSLGGLAWIDGWLGVAVNADSSTFIQLFSTKGEEIPWGALLPHAPVEAFDASGERLVLALSTRSGVRIVAARSAHQLRRIPLPNAQTILAAPAGSRVSMLAIR